MADKIVFPTDPVVVEKGRSFAAVSITLSILSTLLICARVYIRTQPVWRLGPDDYLIIVAYVFVMVDTAVLFATVAWVFEPIPPTQTLADAEQAYKLSVIAQPLWSWSMVFIKTSVAFMFLRVQHSKAWRRFLYFMIVLQVVMGVFSTIFQLTQCIPLSAAWDFLDPGPKRCWSEMAGKVSSNAVSAINIFSDVVFSLIPISFLRKIQRPLSERIVVGVLMGLGLLAAGASVAKTVAVENRGNSSNSSATINGITIGLCSCLEEQLGFIAACLPCLKSLLQSVLIRLRIISPSRYTMSAYGNDGDYRTGGSSPPPDNEDPSNDLGDHTQSSTRGQRFPDSFTRPRRASSNVFRLKTFESSGTTSRSEDDLPPLPKNANQRSRGNNDLDTQMVDGRLNVTPALPPLD